MSQIDNKVADWNQFKRYKPGNLVIYGGYYWKNITGGNSEPGVGNDWLNIGSASQSKPTVILNRNQFILFKNPLNSNKDNQSTLEIGDMVTGWWSDVLFFDLAVYLGGDVNLAGSYDNIIFAEVDDLGAVAFSNDYNDLFNKPTIKAVENAYATYPNMLADQINQTTGNFQRVDDASGHPTVVSGYAYFEYLGTTVGNETDYRKLSEEESMDLIQLVLGETLDTAYRGDRGKTAYDHSQSDHAPAGAITGLSVRDVNNIEQFLSSFIQFSGVSFDVPNKRIQVLGALLNAVNTFTAYQIIAGDGITNPLNTLSNGQGGHPLTLNITNNVTGNGWAQIQLGATSYGRPLRIIADSVGGSSGFTNFIISCNGVEYMKLDQLGNMTLAGVGAVATKGANNGFTQPQTIQGDGKTNALVITANSQSHPTSLYINNTLTGDGWAQIQLGATSYGRPLRIIADSVGGSGYSKLRIACYGVEYMSLDYLGNLILANQGQVATRGANNGFTQPQTIQGDGLTNPLNIASHSQSHPTSLYINNTLTGNGWAQIQLGATSYGRPLRIIADSTVGGFMSDLIIACYGKEYIRISGNNDIVDLKSKQLKGINSLDLSLLGSYTDDVAAATGGVAIGFAYINSVTGAVHRRLT